MASSKNYWDEYYRFWDEFVGTWWSRSGGKPQDDVSRLYRDVVDYNSDELPEPYIGDPKAGVDAVFLNLNPGMSAKGKYGEYDGKSLENTKCRSKLNKKAGWLIREFRDGANCSYREFVKKWSCLNPDLRGHEPEVSGVAWWQGNDPEKVGGRMKWVRQIYDKATLCPSRVFAPEICPFHSKRFPTNRLGNLSEFVKNRVIIPAARAVIENRLPFAIAVGKSYAEVLSKLGAHLEKTWLCDSSTKGWPVNKKNGKPVNRTYELYTFNIEDVGEARFLVTYAQGRNSAPSNKFASVEASIRALARSSLKS